MPAISIRYSGLGRPGDERSVIELEHVVTNTSIESVVGRIKLLALTA